MQEVQKNMTAKEYLLQYVRLTERLRALEDDIEKYEAIATSTAINLDGMPYVQKTSDKVGNMASRVADLKRRKESLMLDTLEQREEIRSTVDRILNARYAMLINLRYIELVDGRQRTWEDIAEQMHMAVSWVRGGLHSQALKEVGRILQTKY